MIQFRLTALVALSLFCAQHAWAEGPAPAAAAASQDCAAQAADKKLAGAAKNSFMKKCDGQAAPVSSAAAACEEKAVSKSGKKLSGAAKNASIKKCMADAKAAK